MISPRKNTNKAEDMDFRVLVNQSGRLRHEVTTKVFHGIENSNLTIPSSVIKCNFVKNELILNYLSNSMPGS